MELYQQIIAAFALDLVLGDPRWLPHPVRWFGWFAARFESLFRRPALPQRLAGFVTASLLVGLAGGSAAALLYAAYQFSPLVSDLLGVVLICFSIASRDLIKHSEAIFRPLVQGDLPQARKQLAWIISRKTEQLDEEGVSRATVESVSENLVDGVTAPLFYATLFGPLGAVVYRAINTLDAMFGYKNEKYIKFGWFSARLDDLANFIPARLTVLFISAVALLLGMRPLRALWTVCRDARKHHSLNAGYPEAAFAGALGVELGGPGNYSGKIVEKPTLGEPLRRIEAKDIRRANRLMFLTVVLFTASCSVVLFHIPAKYKMSELCSKQACVFLCADKVKGVER